MVMNGEHVKTGEEADVVYWHYPAFPEELHSGELVAWTRFEQGTS
jgi:hypothetical protein